MEPHFEANFMDIGFWSMTLPKLYIFKKRVKIKGLRRFFFGAFKIPSDQVLKTYNFLTCVLHSLVAYFWVIPQGMKNPPVWSRKRRGIREVPYYPSG